MTEDASLLMLGNLAVEKQLIDRVQLELALTEQRKTQLPLGEILTKQGDITRNQLKVLLDIHNLKVFYYESIRFGFLAIVNSFVKEEHVQEALERQKSTTPHQYIGDILIAMNVLTTEQRDGLLKTKQRLSSRQEDQKRTIIQCPFCDQSYAVVDPDRYRKARCRHCEMVFEIGVFKHEMRNETWAESTQPANNQGAALPIRERSDLSRLSSFLQQHKIDSNISISVKQESGLSSNNRKYILGKEIARGGMGSIVETIDVDIRRQVVTKILLRNDSKEAIVKFIEEAQITGQLEHPNIVPVYDLGINDEGLVYFTMKRVKGETLLHILEKLHKKNFEYISKYTLEDMLDILLKVCDGVAFAHEKGVIHRDLKPENIMVGEFGEVLTMDWGLAKILGSPQTVEQIESLESSVDTIRRNKDKTKTLQGTIAGTPEYMSPEQAKGRVDQLTVCSDIYSLGAVLYTILEHRLPVDGKNNKIVLDKVIKGEVNDFSDETPPELVSIVQKAMQYKQEDRYQSVYDFRDDIVNYLRGYSVSAKQDTYWETVTKLVRRNQFLSVSIAMILLMIFVFSTIVLIIANRSITNRLEAQEKEKLLEQQAKANALDRQKSAPSLLEIARVLIQNRNYKEAKERINLVIDFAPDIPDTYFYQGLLDYYAEDYGNAIKRFKTYEERILFQNKPQYPVIRVSGLIKNLYSIEDVGVNTVDLFEIQSFFATNNFPQFAEITKEKINQLSVRYENIAYAIDPKMEVKYQNGGVILVLDAFHAKQANLMELKAVPVVEAYVERFTLKEINFLNANYLKKLVLNGSALKNFSSIAQYKNLEWLEMNHTKPTNTHFLKNLHLKTLAIEDCVITDLNVLENMPLTHLNLSGVPISKIDIVAEMPLVELKLSNTLVEDLSPLKNKKLQALDVSSTRVKSLDILKGQPLNSLNIENTVIVDLSILKTSTVENLYLSHNSLSEENIILMNQLRLKYLSIKDFQEQPFKNIIENVSVVCLTGDFLKDFNKPIFKNVIELDLRQCLKLRSIKGVTALTSMESIFLPAGFRNAAPLMTLPNLKFITTPEFGQQASKVFFQIQKNP